MWPDNGHTSSTAPTAATRSISRSPTPIRAKRPTSTSTTSPTAAASYATLTARARARWTAPIAPRDADLVYDGAENAWIHDVAHDADGPPGDRVRPLPVARRPPLHVRALDGQRVERPRDRRRGRIDQRRPARHSTRPASRSTTRTRRSSTCARPIAGTYEIETWRTPDGGAHWTHQPVTAGSDAKNVRPIRPRGLIPFSSDLAVVWVHGIYATYIDYKTSLTTTLTTGGNKPPSPTSARATERTGPPADRLRRPRIKRQRRRARSLALGLRRRRAGLGAAVTHTYARPGRYFPTLTVRDDAGAIDVTVEEVESGPRSRPSC